MTVTKRMSLDSIRRMKDRGELNHDPKAPVGEDLGSEFWARARLEPGRAPRSVRLKLDAEVFAYFREQGRGHLKRMQDVLKAYVRAHTRG